MNRMNLLLGMVGLTTHRHLKDAIDKKKRWHGLVRDVFAQYYVKFRESSLDYLPEIPRRYTADWEASMKAELDEFLKLDLESMGELLETCGFGTERFEQIKQAGFPALGRLIDEHVVGNGQDEERDSADSGNGYLPDNAIAAAVDEDLQYILREHPDILSEFARRFDPESGRLEPTPEDLEDSEIYRGVKSDLDEALLGLRRFRTGGRRALDRIRHFEAHIEALERELEGQRMAPEPLPDLGDNGAEPVAEVAEADADLEAGIAEMQALTRENDRLSEELDDRANAIADRDSSIAERDDTIAELQQRLEELERQASAELDVDAQADDAHEVDTARIDELSAQLEELHRDLQAREQTIEKFQADLKAREHMVEGLRGELEKAQESAEEGLAELRERADSAAELAQQVQQLQNDLKAREHAVESLQEELEKARAQAELASQRGTQTEAAGDAEESKTSGTDLRLAGENASLTDENEQLQRDLSARNQTIENLRSQLDQFEEDMKESRHQLVAEVEKLSALTSGELQLKPSEELEGMEADDLLTYARDVAEDLDVRRQTLNEGLQGIDTIQQSFDANKKVYEKQQRELQSQLQGLRGELDSFERQQAEAMKREAQRVDVDDEDDRETIGAQRGQLELLGTRIRQLMASNQELTQANKKTYQDLETAVHKVIPLRKQIDELQSLQETLQRYIRTKYERTFSMRKLRE